LILLNAPHNSIARLVPEKLHFSINLYMIASHPAFFELKLASCFQVSTRLHAPHPQQTL